MLQFIRLRWHACATFLVLLSDGYTTNDVQYLWSNGSVPVKKYKDITMAQFTLTKISYDNKTMGQNHGKKRYECGRDVVVMWWRCEADVVQMWGKKGEYMVQIRLRCGEGDVQVWY